MITAMLAVVLAIGVVAEAGDTLSGVVRDLDGAPVPGARVDIATGAPKIGPAMFCPSCYLDCVKWTNAGEDGSFAIEGLDPGLKFRVLVTASGMQSRITDLLDPAAESPSITLEPIPDDLAIDRTLNGRVVDASGRPIAGALIAPEGAETPERRWWGLVEGASPTVSGPDGRFRMILDRDFLGVDLEVMASGFAGTSAELLAPGPEEHAIVLPRGARVTGSLVDGTGPVVGVKVAVVQLDRSARAHFIKAVGATTDASGRFTFDSLPADQGYAIFSHVPGNPETSPVLATKRFRVPGDGATRDLGPLEVIPPLSLGGRLVMPDDAPVPPETRLALGRDPAWDLVEVPVSDDGTFSIAPLPPETYAVRVVAKGFEVDPSGLRYQSLGPTSFGVRLDESIADLRVPLRRAEATSAAERGAAESSSTEADRDEVLAEFERGLEPMGDVTLIGRVLKDGQPRAGVSMTLYGSMPGEPNRIGQDPRDEVETDEDGRYAVGGLSVGDRYYFRVRPGDGSADPGWNHQYPYISEVKAGASTFVRLPDIRLIDRGQHLSGIVVDPEGRPVAGVTVSARDAIANGLYISALESGPEPWTETDDRGRFALQQLPDQSIELAVYRPNPEGGPILHPAKTRPDRDQDDIRIVFDPTLTEEPEDLDAGPESTPSP